MAGKLYEMNFVLGATQGQGFKSTFSQAQAEFVKLGEKIQSLNKTQADILSYQRQQSAIDRTTQKLEDLRAKYDEVEQAIKENGGETAELTRKKGQLEGQIKTANARLADQQDKLGVTANKLHAAGIGTDNLAGKSKELSALIGNLSQEQQEAAQSAEQYQNNAVSAFQAAGDALAAAGLIAGIKQLGDAYIGTVQAAGEFGATMSNVEALSGASRQEMALLNAQAKELGATTKFTANESGEAMGYMGMAGWNAQQMLAGMPGVLDLAAASGEDLAGVADIVTDSLTGFGMTAADTGRFVDVLATASTKSNTNVSMLGESFKYVAPLCGTLGYEAEDAAVSLGLMANAGIKGSQAGTTLRTAITNMISPTKDQAAEMKRLGISLTDTNGQMLPMLDMVGNLRAAFSGMSEAEQSAAASTIFGKEAMSGMLAIINASEADYQSLAQSIENSAGAAERMANIKLDNLAGDLTLLQSATDGLSLSIGEQFMPQARGVVQIGTDIIGWINQVIEEHPALTKTVMATTGMIGALTAGMSALAAAKKAAAMIDLASMFVGAGPILAGVGAFTALMAGTLNFTDAVRDGLPKVEELTEAARGLNGAVEEASGGFEKSQTDIQATADMADHYIARLESLESVSNRTKEQQAEYHATLAMLAETVPELAGSIDLETDSIEGGTQALREQTAAWEENAKAQAYQDALGEIYAAQADAELEHQKNVVLLTNAQADLREVEEQRAALMRQQTQLAEEYGFTYSEALNGAAAQAGHSAEEIQAYTDRHSELEVQIASLDGQMEDAEKYVTQYGKAVKDSEAALSEAESTTGSYQEAMEALSPAIDSAADSASRAVDTNAGLWTSMEEIREEADSLSAAYQEAYGQAYSSIQGQYDLWDKAAKVSATSAADINAALESQVGYWQNYNANLAFLQERSGEIQGLRDVIADFSDGSADSVNAVAGMASATDEELSAMVGNWQRLQEEHDTTSNSLAEFATDFTNKMDELGQALREDVEGMDYSKESGEAARSMMNSYVGEFEEALPRVQAAIANLRGAVLSGLGSASAGRAHGLTLPIGLNGYATGTTNAEPGFAMVGEDGPEVVLFGGGEQVLNARETAAMQRQSAVSAIPARGNGGITITLSPVYNLSGDMNSAAVRNELDRHDENLKQFIISVVQDYDLDCARRRY